ncbi:MAG: serine/threonine-protein kinase [Thermoanaerobaculia bacterium]|nr:serine/threonine-protein kinase [Thermoanaerobaculia bacterium]
MTGRRLGSYEIEKEIGRGGMGVVYRARQPSLQRTVALKVLPGHLAKDAGFVERFLREARAAARLHHPGIVTVFDVGESDDTFFFAMQLLPGASLAELLAAQKRLSTRQVASLGIQVADALSYAHREGILHRDIKPANLLIDRDGRCVLTDFGIALALTDTRLTQTGASLGSPHYMAPEILNGKSPDARCDLYALGVVMFEALTGRPPYQGDSPLAIAYQHVAEHLPRVREVLPEASEELDLIIAKLMAKEPEQRYQRAAEVARDLLQVTGGVVQALPSASATGGDLPPTPVPPTPVEPVVTPPAPSAAKKRFSPARAGFAVVLAALAVAAALYLGLERPWQSPAATGPATPPGDPVANGGAQTPPEPPGRPEAGDSDAGPAPGPVAPPTDPPATPPLAESFTVTSEPPGAAVFLAGQRLDGATPVEISVTPGAAVDLRLELAGYERSGMSVDLEELPDELRASRQLHFPLTPVTPPGTVTASAPYPVTLSAAGRRGSGRLSLPPGTHRVELSAPSVYYAATRTVEVRSGEETALELPAVARVAVAAAPSRCKVRIDGREVDFVPFTVELAVGTHRFDFDWETLGVTRTVEQEITAETDRVFAAASEGEG